MDTLVSNFCTNCNACPTLLANGKTHTSRVRVCEADIPGQSWRINTGRVKGHYGSKWTIQSSEKMATRARGISWPRAKARGNLGGTNFVGR